MEDAPVKASDFPPILREFARMSFPSDSGRKDMPVSKGLARVRRLEAKMQAELQARHEAAVRAAIEAETKPRTHFTLVGRLRVSKRAEQVMGVAAAFLLVCTIVYVMSRILSTGRQIVVKEIPAPEVPPERKSMDSMDFYKPRQPQKSVAPK
jgi:hypothetical protein